MFIMSKKEDKIMKELGGIACKAHERSWWVSYYDHMDDCMRPSNDTITETDYGFKFLGSVIVTKIRGHKDQIEVFDRLDPESYLLLDKKEFFQDPEYYIKLVDSGKEGKDKYLFFGKEEYKSTIQKIREVIQKKGGKYSYSDQFGWSKVDIYGIDDEGNYKVYTGSNINILDDLDIAKQILS